jgi:hypothetical protein
LDIIVVPFCSEPVFRNRTLVPVRNRRDNFGITPFFARINVATNHVMHEVISSSNFPILILAHLVPTIHTQFTGSAHIDVLDFQKVKSSPSNSPRRPGNGGEEKRCNSTLSLTSGRDGGG